MTRPIPPARTARADGDDLESLPWAGGAAPATNNGAKGVTHRRHRWVDGPSMGITFVTCVICGAFRDRAASRRGRSSLRAGKDAERAVAKAYGGRRTGQYGGPDDVVVGELFVIQSKAGRTWFRQAIWDELAKLPRTGGRIPTLVISDRPGQGGGPTRRYVIRTLADDVALHGEKP
jgi:hypothetical protein